MIEPTRLAVVVSFLALGGSLPAQAPAENGSQPRPGRPTLTDGWEAGAPVTALVFKGAVYYQIKGPADSIQPGRLVGRVNARRLPPGDDSTALGKLPGCEYPDLPIFPDDIDHMSEVEPRIPHGSAIRQ